MRKLILLILILSSCQIQSSENKSKKVENKIYSQTELAEILMPELKSSGLQYKKFKEVLARKAKAGEKISTITGDGLETVNTANDGDFIIKNQTEAGEMYIIGAKKFQERYDFLKEAEDGFSFYKSKGKIKSLEMTDAFLKKMNLPEEFHFIAPWNEKMIVKKDDFLVCPMDYSQIYRIARKEFFETYKPDF